jgi:tetratricopeptide (TPR) repeat protein/tRNA A-37 threonylcarbamoyl transferase component Bud32
MIGKRVAHYTITEKLGQGGMGVVYKAKDTKLARSVALKFLPDSAVASDDDRARFVREAQAAAGLDHPNICTIYEIGEAGGHLFIAMAFVDGDSVKERVDRDGALPPAEAIRIAIQVADALAAAHEHGIVHRDIKSANVMLTAKGRALVMDFGLAERMDRVQAAPDSSTLGTVAYGAPEQARGEPVDHRSDIWSLGVTLYEMLTGTLPFSGDYESAVVYSVLNQAPSPPSSVGKGLSPELDAIVVKMLAKDPEQRYARADEVARELRRILAMLDPDADAGPATWLGRFTSRAVVMTAGLYGALALAAWKAVSVAAGRMMLSPYLADTVLVGLLSLTPAVVLVAAYLAHRASAPRRPLAIGVPVNVLATGVILALLFSGKDLGAAAHKVSLTTEEGETIERIVPKETYRRRFALFVFDNRTGDAANEWLQYAVPLLLEYDAYQDAFIQTRSAFENSSLRRLRDAGFESWSDAPLALKRKIAGEFHMDHFVVGGIDRAPSPEAPEYVVSVRLYRTETAKALVDRQFSGPDLTRVVDEITVDIKEALALPDWHLDQSTDVPVAELVTANVVALQNIAIAQEAMTFEQDWEEGVRRLEAAVAMDSTMAFTFFQLFMLYNQSSRPQDAQRALEACLRHSYRLPERIQFIVKANFYFSGQQPEKAHAVVKMMVELYPDDPQGYSALGQISHFRNDLDGAIAAYERILELDPYRYEHILQIGDLYKEKNDYARAVTYYERYAAIDPSDVQSYRSLADVYARLGQLDQAKETLERALLVDPSRTGVMIDLAGVETKLGNFDDAVSLCDDALAKARPPEDRIAALDALQDYYELRGRIGRAIELQEQRWAEAAKIFTPVMTEVQKLQRVRRYVMAGREAEAFRVMREVEAKLSAPPMSKAVPFGYLGIHLERRDPDAAEEALVGVNDYIESFRLDLLRPYYRLAQGLIAEMRDDCAGAITDFESVVSERPDEIVAYVAAGRCQRKSGNLEAAEKVLLEALKLHPYEPEANYELARVYQQMGRGPQARERIDRALAVWDQADPAYRLPGEARRASDAWRAAERM